MKVQKGEFNSDSNVDLVIYESFDGGAYVNLYINNGSGRFTHKENLWSGYPYGVNTLIVTDINNDFADDVVLATIYDGLLVYRYNRDQEKFSPPDIYPCTDCKIVVSDFDIDGDADIAISDGSILINSGSEILAGAASFSSNLPSPGEIITNDFDADGDPDLATLTDNILSIFLNSGGMRFKTPEKYDAGTAGTNLASAQLNSDGYPDIILSGFESTNIFYNNQKGGFQKPITKNASYNGLIEDINADGSPDIIGFNKIVLNNRNGDFLADLNYEYDSNLSPSTFALIDINNDYKLDLLNFYRFDRAGRTEKVRYNIGDKNFQAATFSNVGPSPAVATGSRLIPIDLDTSPGIDLILEAEILRDHLEAFVLSNAGDGAFITTAELGVIPSPGAISDTILTPGICQTQQATGDVNSDGKADLVCITNNSIAVYLRQNYDNVLQTPIVSSTSNIPPPSSIQLRDVNSDSHVDLTIISDNGNTLEAAFTVFLGDGNGRFSKARTISQVGISTFGGQLADLNRDGLPDIVGVNFSDNIDIHFSLDPDRFVKRSYHIGFDRFTNIVNNLEIADINGDSFEDLIVPGGNSDISAVLYNRAGSSFGSPVLLQSASGGLAIFDADGDGMRDIIGGNSGSVVSTLLNNFP